MKSIREFLNKKFNITIDPVVVEARQCEEDVALSFSQYYSSPTIDNLFQLLRNCLSNEMANSNLSKVNFGIKKVNCNATFEVKTNTIAINSQKLKDCQDVNQLQRYLNYLFHEYTHAVIEGVNRQIILTGENKENYCQPFVDNVYMNLFLKYLNNDYELAATFANYFYVKNPNEIRARKEGFNLSEKYMNRFGKILRPEYSFEDGEKIIRQSIFLYYRNFKPQFAEGWVRQTKENIEKKIKNGENLNDCVGDYIVFSSLGNAEEYFKFLKSVDGLFDNVNIYNVINLYKNPTGAGVICSQSILNGLIDYSIKTEEISMWF